MKIRVELTDATPDDLARLALVFGSRFVQLEDKPEAPKAEPPSVPAGFPPVETVKAVLREFSKHPNASPEAAAASAVDAIRAALPAPCMLSDYQLATHFADDVMSMPPGPSGSMAAGVAFALSRLAAIAPAAAAERPASAPPGNPLGRP